MHPATRPGLWDRVADQEDLEPFRTAFVCAPLALVSPCSWGIHVMCGIGGVPPPG